MTEPEVSQRTGEERVDLAISDSLAERFKRRMLEWPNPVEFVNNMYGCHPGDHDDEYFEHVYR